MGACATQSMRTLFAAAFVTALAAARDQADTTLSAPCSPVPFAFTRREPMSLLNKCQFAGFCAVFALINIGMLCLLSL